jgi:threonylcarbamoyladenosine tRNA methylthiotransferase MtaB
MRIADFIDVPHKLPAPVVRKSKISRTPFTISSVGNYEHATRANLKIQDGCDFMCSFCVIPFARGRARSRAFWDIQREAIELVELGHKEIVLTGVNIGTYDFDGKTLLDVIKMLEKIDGLERIRISSIEPTTIPNELIDYMAESPKLCHHLHIPIQSGDDTVLKNMRRLYSVAAYAKFLERVQTRIPDICFGTDVMVGFPGEGDVEFNNTVELLRESPFGYFHVFSFSERGGTAAAKMQNRVNLHTKKERSQVLRTLSQKKRAAFYRQHIGQTVRVLMEDRNEHGLFQGLTDNYIKVGVRTEADLSNQLVDIHVVGFVNAGLLTGILRK